MANKILPYAVAAGVGLGLAGLTLRALANTPPGNGGNGGPVPVPNVLGLTQSQATTLIVNAGLVVGAVLVQPDVAAAGTVIDQSPLPGVAVVPGTAVGLLVSAGPGGGQVAVPNVLGLTQSQATTLIVNAGLVVGAVLVQLDVAPAGTVIDQSPLAGVAVVPGTAVDLLVSTGPTPPSIIPITGAHSQMYVVPAGQTHELMGAVDFNNVSLVVMGVGAVLRARPGASLTFSGINYANYVPGPTFDPATQIGLHLMQGGRLDFQSTPKRPFTTNGAGDDPSWRPGDEVFATPRTFGSITSTPHIRGNPAPLNEYGEPAEVFNTTRDVLIQGTPQANAFIMIHPDAGLSTCEYVSFRYLGIPVTDSSGNRRPMSGKFSVHHHQRGDRSRGELVLGCVFRDCLGHAIWPHNSHGMSFIDNVVYNIESEGIGWDIGSGQNARLGNESHDGYYEGNLITDIKWTPDFRHRAQGIVLAQGLNNVFGPGNIVCGVQGSGFVWPEISDGYTDYTPWIHDFPVKIHHCSTQVLDSTGGVNVWQNPEGHILDDFPVDVTSCHVGVRIGAYVTTGYTYRIRQIRNCRIALASHAQGGNRGDGYGLRILGEGEVRDCDVGIVLAFHNGAAQVPVLYFGVPFVNCGVIIEERSSGGAQPSRTDLVECTRDGVPLTSLLTSGQNAPTTVYAPASPHPSSVLRVQNGTTAFQISAAGLVTAIAPFF